MSKPIYMPETIIRSAVIKFFEEKDPEAIEEHLANYERSMAHIRDQALEEGQRRGWKAAADHIMGQARDMDDTNPYRYHRVPR